jgi:hypothetical protein
MGGTHGAAGLITGDEPVWARGYFPQLRIPRRKKWSVAGVARRAMRGQDAGARTTTRSVVFYRPEGRTPVFARKVVRPETKSTSGPTSAPERPTYVGYRLGRDLVEQVLFLQRAIGNQATLSLARRIRRCPKTGAPATRSKRSAERALQPRQHIAVSWDLSRVPLFPSERANSVQPSLPPAATPIRNGHTGKARWDRPTIHSNRRQTPLRTK